MEWRALTVALLDRLAVQVRDHLGVSAEAYPLTKILEGRHVACGSTYCQRETP